MVNCPICRIELTNDYFECPQCGHRNPNTALTRRTAVVIHVDDSLLRTMERIAIKTGKSMDELLNQAAEYWVAQINAKKVGVF